MSNTISSHTCVCEYTRSIRYLNTSNVTTAFSYSPCSSRERISNSKNSYSDYSQIMRASNLETSYFSSSSPVCTILIEITLSLSLSFVRITPCATRPVRRTHFRGLRTVMPDLVTRTKSAFFFSSSLSIVAETIFPVFGVIAPTFTPDPPRP